VTEPVAAPTRELPAPTALEVHANILLGDDPGAPPLPQARDVGVRAALEEVMLPALRRPPAVVSFSGGRDSSAILAVATDVARRHGLDDPVPAIMRFPDAPATDETEWQELVLGHLAIERTEVIELRDELDALGPTATAGLQRRGVRWPGNAYLHEPVLERAAGGSLLTGVGGDELFGSRASPHVWLFRARRRPNRGDPRALADAALPRRLRAARWRAREAPPFPWLTPARMDVLSRVIAREEVSWPHRWDRSVVFWHASRAFSAVTSAIPALAEAHDVLALNPFVEPPVLAELMRAGGATGFPSRTTAMRRLFGDLLPDALLARETKAAFSAPVWGPRARAFASDWSGEGVDPEEVDVDAVRGQWLSEKPDGRTILVLHAAWLACQAGAGQSSAASS